MTDEARPGSVEYRSGRYRATRFATGGRAVVVALDHWRVERPGFPRCRQWQSVAELGYDQISVDAMDNDWFLSAETDGLGRYLEGAVAGYDEVVLFGSSMGGFGALLFSGLADRVCLISPQYSIDRRLCPFETRWPGEAAAVEALVDVAEVGRRDVAGYVVYDPSSAGDARHAAMIRQAFPRVVGIGLPFSGHPASGTVVGSGEGRAFLKALMRGDATMALARDLHRRGRRQSPIYLLETAQRIAGRDPAWARALLLAGLDRAGAVRENDARAGIVFRIASRLVDVGDFSKIHHMRWALANRTTAPAWWRRRIREACALRDAAEGRGDVARVAS